jgi:hypothetical protein
MLTWYQDINYTTMDSQDGLKMGHAVSIFPPLSGLKNLHTNMTQGYPPGLTFIEKI